MHIRRQGLSIAKSAKTKFAYRNLTRFHSTAISCSAKMIQTHRISRLLNVTRTHLWLRSGSYKLSSSADPAQPPSGHRKESSEQAVGGTTDDIAHSKGAFDSGEANPHKSAAKLSSSGIDMEQSAAYAGSSLSSEKTPTKKKAPNTQK
ncbi:hypothetical protein PCANC_18098 [Puccinia coronata f. sp. avenae]|uniref:Uncharacterized protein n=1 Tax=Puccinia coronata f. sp. avenae TaxID=200324 RepID=A0A2N5SL98_9BASI|nr:hypothetical protein PCANC_18098 [Puccinia coronata f. sp. avenae]